MNINMDNMLLIGKQKIKAEKLVNDHKQDFF